MTPSWHHDDEYEGPNQADHEALAQLDTEFTPTRTNTIPPRTLQQALHLADQQHLEPWTSHNGRWIGLHCPTCQTLGHTSNAIIETSPAGHLIASCPTCHDNIHPGILNTLGTITQTNTNGNKPHTDQPPPVELLNLDQLLANPPPDPNFAWGNQTGGYIEQGTLAVLHGDGGLGKSLIGQGLCRKYTLNHEWLGQTTSGGVALYLDGENSLAEIARRLYAFEFRPGDQNLKYGRVSIPILINPTTGETLLTNLIQETNATLIVLDSQRALWSGDEREQLEVRPLYDMLARLAEHLQVAILLIHHDNKSGIYSGSTDINAAVVSRLHLERKDPRNRDDRRRVLWHEKSRSGPEQPPVTFSVDKTLDGLLTFQIHPNDTPTSPGRPRTSMRERILETHADRIPRTRSETAQELGLEHTNSTLRRTWKELIDEGTLTTQDNLHWN